MRTLFESLMNESKYDRFFMNGKTFQKSTELDEYFKKYLGTANPNDLVVIDLPGNPQSDFDIRIDSRIHNVFGVKRKYSKIVFPDSNTEREDKYGYYNVGVLESTKYKVKACRVYNESRFHGLDLINTKTKDVIVFRKADWEIITGLNKDLGVNYDEQVSGFDITKYEDKSVDKNIVSYAAKELGISTSDVACINVSNKTKKFENIFDMFFSFAKLPGDSTQKKFSKYEYSEYRFESILHELRSNKDLVLTMTPMFFYANPRNKTKSNFSFKIFIDRNKLGSLIEIM